MKALYTHHGGGVLVPDDPDDEAWLELPRGEYMVTVRRSRNPQNHKRFFKMVTILMDRTELFQGDNPTRETLKQRWVEYLMVGAGFCDTFVTPEGELLRVRKSIAFDEMDEVDFMNMFKACVATALRVVPARLVDDINAF